MKIIFLFNLENYSKLFLLYVDCTFKLRIRYSVIHFITTIKLITILKKK